MTKNVDQFEVTWDNDLIYLWFADAFGKGWRYGFPPEQMEKMRDIISESLLRHREGL